MPALDASSPAVEVRDLEREFKGGIRAVDGLDLDVSEGEIYGFLGPNGAGKTTVVRILTTLLRPTGGRALVAGHDVVKDGDAVRRSIGVALQEAAIDPLMTGRELLRMQGALHGLRGREARERAQSLLARVGLTEAGDRRVGGYSGGMRRRLDLALALVHRPLVLFLDEPTTGLDVTSRAALWREVRALNAEGTTVFLTTQYLEEAEQLADRVGIIAKGRLVAEGTPSDLKDRVGQPTVHVEVCDPASAGRARDGALRAGRARAAQREGAHARGAAHGRRHRGDRAGHPGAGRVRRRGRGRRGRGADARRRLRGRDGLAPRGCGRAGAGARGRRRGRMSVLAREGRVVLALGRRALSVQFRRAQLLMPTFVLPLMLLAVITSGTSAAVGLRGFPDVTSYLTFIVPGTIVQGTVLAGLTAGIAMASDIEFGFFDRLLAAPVRRTSLVLGRLWGTMGLGALQATFFLLVALLFGASYPGGPAAAVAVVALAAITAVGMGGIAAAIALRTGSLSLLQSLFPFMFVLLFTAPAFFPQELLNPVLRDVSVYNPLTYVVEGVRALLADDPSLGDPWAGLAAAAGLAVATTVLATLALKERLRTT